MGAEPEALEEDQACPPTSPSPVVLRQQQVGAGVQHTGPHMVGKPKAEMVPSSAAWRRRPLAPTECHGREPCPGLLGVYTPVSPGLAPDAPFLSPPRFPTSFSPPCWPTWRGSGAGPGS